MSRIDVVAAQVRGVSDADLREMIAALRARVAAGESLDGVLPEAFAVVGQACARVGGVAATRQQFVAGVALHLGYVADVRDGEGRDVAVLLAAVLGALGGGVHVMTSAQRHVARAQTVGQLLGVRVGALTPGMSADDRRNGYLADITCGMADEFAYDYLRDNLAWSLDRTVQRGCDRVIVEDADVVLIDDCVVPRVISVAAPKPAWAWTCARLAAVLVAGRHYTTANGTIWLTDEGAALAADSLGVQDLYDQRAGIVTSLRMALQAKDFYRRGQDYEVVEGRITGPDGQIRAWRHGLQQALEAKEGVPITAPRKVMATITTRQYLRLYRAMSGISAAAGYLPEAFDLLYGLDVVTVPPGRPSGLVEHEDRLFGTDAERDDAVLGEALRRQEAGQRVVIGTVDGPSAGRIVAALTEAGVGVGTVLSADPEPEVTVLTAAACRGVEAAWEGLAVLGAGRHRSRRHDEPLRGLAGRDGTRGECAFFLSLTEVAAWDGAQVPENTPPLPEGGLSNAQVSEAVRGRQRDLDLATVRGAVDISQVFDDLLQEQCAAAYAYRRRLLLGDGDIAAEFGRMLEDVVEEMMDGHADVLGGSDRRAIASLLAHCPVAYPATTPRRLARTPAADIQKVLLEDARLACRIRCYEVDRLGGPGTTQDFQRKVAMSCLDRLWRTHLAAMDDLYADIRSRPVPVADMASEFRAEATAACAATWSAVWQDTVAFFFHLQIEVEGQDR